MESLPLISSDKALHIIKVHDLKARSSQVIQYSMPVYQEYLNFLNNGVFELKLEYDTFATSYGIDYMKSGGVTDFKKMVAEPYQPLRIYLLQG